MTEYDSVHRALVRAFDRSGHNSFTEGMAIGIARRPADLLEAMVTDGILTYETHTKTVNGVELGPSRHYFVPDPPHVHEWTFDRTTTNNGVPIGLWNCGGCGEVAGTVIEVPS